MLKKSSRALIAVIMLTLVVLSSCGKPTNSPSYDMHVVEFSDAIGMEGVVKSKDFNFHDEESYKEFEPAKTLTVEFNGEKYVVSYTGEIGYPSKCYYPTYKYKGDGINVSVKSDGFVTRVYKPDGYAKGESYLYSEEQYEKIATEFASKIIDMEGYKITDSSRNETQSLYAVYFHKYIGDLKTAEYIRILMNADGTVYTYECRMPNEFSKDTVNPFDMEKAQEKVDAYLEEKVDSIRDKYDRVECEGEFQLTKLKNNKYGLLYIAKVRGITEYGDGFIGRRSEQITLLIE